MQNSIGLTEPGGEPVVDLVAVIPETITGGFNLVLAEGLMAAMLSDTVQVTLIAPRSTAAAGFVVLATKCA